MHTRQYKHPGHELQCTASCAWSMHKMSQNAPPACYYLWRRTWDCPRTCIPCVRMGDCHANMTTCTIRVAAWFLQPPQCRRAHWNQCLKGANRPWKRDKKREKTCCYWFVGCGLWVVECGSLIHHAAMALNGFVLCFALPERGFLKHVHVHETVLVLFLRVNAPDE